MGTKRVGKGEAKRPVNVAALFAGVGGIECGLKRAGFKTKLLCEFDPSARAVLETWFRRVPLVDDIRALDSLPSDIDLLTAGFPCQDLSQAGATKGLDGDKSSLITYVFKLLERQPVPWVLLENVPFMLQLGKGAAMRFVVDELERLGYRWAYRVVDSRAFGIPQRRERVFLLATHETISTDPANLLFAEDAGPPPDLSHVGRACGFYWTEGNRGLGWAVDSVPTLKGGSTVGIPSPPAIWMPEGNGRTEYRIVTPDIKDAERLQGFEPNWTLPAADVGRASYRWKLVGNAVTVDSAEWVGRCITQPVSLAKPLAASLPLPLTSVGAWPKAAFGSREGGRFGVSVSTWPVRQPAIPLIEFLKEDLHPLSEKATAGFVSRLRKSCLRYPAEFMRALEGHLDDVAGRAPLRALSGGKRA